MDTEVTTIAFHDQPLVAQRTTNGYLTALKPICENIGLDYSSQLKRLKRQPWAVVAMMTTTGADGKNYDMVAIDRRTLTMWLATIDTSRIKNDHTRQQATTYQTECADALDAYFTDGAAIRTQPGDSDDDLIARALLAAQHKIEQRDRQLAQQTQQLATQQAQINRQEPMVALAEQFVAARGTVSIRDAARNLQQIDPAMTCTRVYRILRDHGYIEQHTNAPTVKATRPGYLKPMQPPLKDGRLARQYAHFTPRGIAWFIRRFIYCQDNLDLD